MERQITPDQLSFIGNYWKLLEMLGKEGMNFLKENLEMYIGSLKFREMTLVLDNIGQYFSGEELKPCFEINGNFIANSILMRLIKLIQNKGKIEQEINRVFVKQNEVGGEELSVLLRLMVKICSCLLETEFRCVESKIFASRLVQYYAQKDCSVWFKMKRELGYIYMYYLLPKGNSS